jgi:hypothetical protein
MRLFRRHHYRLVKGRDGDRNRCLIIIAARRVGDGPFLEAGCTASVQENCHHSHSPGWACVKKNMGLISNYSRRSTGVLEQYFEDYFGKTAHVILFIWGDQKSFSAYNDYGGCWYDDVLPTWCRE